jgi:hypothetical protein
MYPHRMRLRGPWTCQPLFRFTQDGSRVTADLPAAFRMTMPCRWQDGGLSDFRGGVRLLRRFGYPGRIDDFERVWLTFEGAQERATATLNDHLLGTWEGAAEFEVTALLKPRNTLMVEVVAAAAGGGLWGDVALEVRATAYLKDVTFHLEEAVRRLTATGRVAGEAARPLDLYLFAGDQFLDHRMVGADQRFEIAADLSPLQSQTTLPVRIELVDAATIWYVVEGTVTLGQSNEAGDSS